MIPETIERFISPEVRDHLSPELVNQPIGGTAVMHTHNTLPNMAQKYKLPIWKVPDTTLDKDDVSTIRANANTIYRSTKEKYQIFDEDFLKRIETLD